MMIKVEAIVREEKFEDVKAALNEIEVNGITVSQVMGCGAQRGYKEDVYKRQSLQHPVLFLLLQMPFCSVPVLSASVCSKISYQETALSQDQYKHCNQSKPVSYTHLCRCILRC